MLLVMFLLLTLTLHLLIVLLQVIAASSSALQLRYLQVRLVSALTCNTGQEAILKSMTFTKFYEVGPKVTTNRVQKGVNIQDPETKMSFIHDFAFIERSASI